MPRDQSTLIEEKKRVETERDYYAKNLAAARRRKEQISQQIVKLEQDLLRLREEDQKRSIIRSAFGKLSKTGQQQADTLSSELRKLQEGKAFRFDGREFDIDGLLRHCEAETRVRSVRIASIDKELRERSALDARQAREQQAAERHKRQEERRKQQVALAATRIEKQRELAEGVKRNLSRDHPCPYCGQELGELPHADHIYPVSKGGLSVPYNMVLACQSCNRKKGDMPIMDFIFAHSLDVTSIITTLRKMGKKI
jgi:5-methylcytosine-specific restriction endonuclease McrA